MFNLGIAEATSNATARLDCGCYVQNYARIVMWSPCGPTHDMLMLLGFEREAISELVDQVRAVLDGRRYP